MREPPRSSGEVEIEGFLALMMSLRLDPLRRSVDLDE
jgi:hypothetical protein